MLAGEIPEGSRSSAKKTDPRGKEEKMKERREESIVSMGVFLQIYAVFVKMSRK